VLVAVAMVLLLQVDKQMELLIQVVVAVVVAQVLEQQQMAVQE
jgi:Na+/H+ antiporter NhaC